MWTVGGLMAVACVAESYPLAGNRQLASPSSASLSTMLIAFGGVTSTVAKLMGDFTEKALLDSGSEDVVMTDGGFSLTAAVLSTLAPLVLFFCPQPHSNIGWWYQSRHIRFHSSDIPAIPFNVVKLPFASFCSEALALTPFSWLVQMLKMKVDDHHRCIIDSSQR